jgi:hypothetical protein
MDMELCGRSASPGGVRAIGRKEIKDALHLADAGLVKVIQSGEMTLVHSRTKVPWVLIVRTAKEMPSQRPVSLRQESFYASRGGHPCAHGTRTRAVIYEDSADFR